MTPAQLDLLVAQHNRAQGGKGRGSRPEQGGAADLLAFARMPTGG